MGKFEQEYFRKHFKTIARLKAFRKRFNEWEYSHGGKGVWFEFNNHSFHFNENGNEVDEHGNLTKWIRLTKQKVDKEILRIQQNND